MPDVLQLFCESDTKRKFCSSLIYSTKLERRGKHWCGTSTDPPKPFTMPHSQKTINPAKASYFQNLKQAVGPEALKTLDPNTAKAQPYRPYRALQLDSRDIRALRRNQCLPQSLAIVMWRPFSSEDLEKQFLAGRRDRRRPSTLPSLKTGIQHQGSLF